MSDGTFRLSLWQLIVLVFTVGLCVNAFAFPGAVSGPLAREGWLATLPAIATGLWGTLVAATIARHFSGEPFDRIVRGLLGDWLALPYLVAMVLLFAVGAVVNLHVFVQMSTAVELTHLPPVYPAVLTGAVATLAAYFGPEVVARTGEMVAPIVAAGLILVYVPLAASAHVGRLLPLGTPPLVQLLDPAGLASLGVVRGFLPLLVIGPWCRPELRAGPLCAATATAGALILASVALPVTLFGANFTAQIRYPLLAATGTLTWQWLPIHHLVAVTLVVWHAIVTVVFAAYLWMGAWLLRRLVARLSWAAALAGLAAIETAAAALPVSSALSRTVMDGWNGAVVILGVLAPTLLLALASRRAAARLGSAA